MKNKKLKLTELRAQSFVTVARRQMVKGGEEITFGTNCESSHPAQQCLCRPW